MSSESVDPVAQGGEYEQNSKPADEGTWGHIFLKEYATAKVEESNKPRDIVVNFPQGQKLTIRDLEPGTIVEVASWAGKGLPGDEAVRMLFGANSPSADDEDHNEDQANSSPPDMQSQTVRVDDLNKDPAFDETMRSRPTPHMAEQSFRRSRQNRKARKSRSLAKSTRRAAIAAGSLVVLAGIVLGLRFGNLLYFEHPSSGVSTGLGDANTAVFAVNPGADIEIGSTLVAVVDGEKVVVSVIQMAEAQLLVSGGSGQRAIGVPDVIGRVVFVIPFIGYVAGAF